MYRIILFLLCALLMAGCVDNEEQPPPDKVIAELNGEYLTEADVKVLFPNGKWGAMTDSQKRDFIEKDWKQLTLLAQAADKQGIGERPDIKLKAVNAAKRVKANALLAEVLVNVPEPTEEEMLQYFRMTSGEYENQEETLLKIQRIAVTNPVRAEEIVGLLNQGSSFKQLAMENSITSDGSNGGFLGFRSASQLGHDLYKKLMDAGKMNHTTHTSNDTIFVIRYYDTDKQSREITFRDAMGDIRDKMIIQRKAEAYDKFIAELEKNSSFILNDLR